MQNLLLHRQWWQLRGDGRPQVRVAPGGHVLKRHAQRIGPVPEVERQADPQACDPPTQDLGQFGDKFGDRLAHEAQHPLGRRKPVRLLPRPVNAPDEIDRHQLNAPPADLEPKETGAVRGKVHGHRGLADSATTRLAALQFRQEMLQIQVDSGMLSLDAYLQTLREAIPREKARAVAFKQKPGGTRISLDAVRHMKLMETELAEATAGED